MKITKRQLKRIIMEEKQKLLKEAAQRVIGGVGFGSHGVNTGFHSARLQSATPQHSTPAEVAVKRSARRNTVHEIEQRFGRPEKKMRITKLQLQKIIRDSRIREDITDVLSQRAQWKQDEDDIINALLDTWDQVSVDVDIPNPTPEDKSDEALAGIQALYPEVADLIASKSNQEMDELLDKAFGPMGVAHSSRDFWR